MVNLASLFIPRQTGSRSDQRSISKHHSAQYAGFSVLNILFLPLGLLVAIKKDTFLDRAISSIAVILQSFPCFWVGILLIASLP